MRMWLSNRVFYSFKLTILIYKPGLLEHILFFTMNDSILKASEDQMKTAVCPKPRTAPAGHRHDAGTQPAHLESSHHSRSHCIQTHTALRRSSSFQSAGPQRPFSLPGTSSPLPVPGTSTGNLTAHRGTRFPHCSLAPCSFSTPLTSPCIY